MKKNHLKSNKVIIRAIRMKFKNKIIRFNKVDSKNGEKDD